MTVSREPYGAKSSMRSESVTSGGRFPTQRLVVGFPQSSPSMDLERSGIATNSKMETIDELGFAKSPKLVGCCEEF